MRKRQSFTSLDITNWAKADGFRVRNYQVADWLRRNVIVEAHSMGYQYNQSLITVDSKADGITLAYLYHHYQVDADDYLDRDQNPQSFKPTYAPKTPTRNNDLPSMFDLTPSHLDPGLLDPYWTPCVDEDEDGMSQSNPQVSVGVALQALSQQVHFPTRQAGREFATANPKYIVRDMLTWDASVYRLWMHNNPDGNNRWVCYLR